MRAGVPDSRSKFAGFLLAAADALDGQGSREVTLADGRRSIEFVTAAYASAQSGAPVALPLGENHPSDSGWRTGSRAKGG